MSTLRPVSAAVDFAALEHRVLARWRAEQTFARSLAARADAPEYTVYEGPPFATGLPHYGHLLTSYVKDVVPRYFTMRGFRVPRRFGWDCHGLPVECEAEKALGLGSRTEVLAHGVARFNDACRGLVDRYAGAWRATVDRLGRWVDWDATYHTMDADYMDSVLWCFRALYDRGLVYEGTKVVHYCVRCQTPLSNFEARQDDATRARRDLAVTVRLPLADAPRESLLVWTTTPWTLPANLAVAVAADATYARYEHADGGGDSVWLAAEAAPRYTAELAGYHERERCAGSALVGRRYEPPFAYFAHVTGAFVVTAAPFVQTGEGTGLVHLAPAYGEDDAAACAALGLGSTDADPVRDDGTYDARVADFAGRSVLAVSDEVARALAARGRLAKRERLEHNHPHCWRCDAPLVHRAVRSWFVRATALKARLLANNAQVRWVPPHAGQGRFRDWLENVRDWAVSRDRFWGAPVPVWRCTREGCGAVHVAGSRRELEDLSGAPVPDLHRPAVDAVEFPCRACGAAMRRVPQVLDCWFESGAMPYAQAHYPFERRAEFDAGFPGEFVVEYVAQTRGWFYTMLVLSTALFDRPPFRSAVCHGVVLGADGRKMSKRLRNYPDPDALLEAHGSDALRVALLSSAVVRGEDARFAEAAVADVVRRVHLPLWNCLHLFTTSAAADGFAPRGLAHSTPSALDRYLLAETEALRAAVEAAMEAFDFAGAYARLEQYVTTLSTWYVRLTRAMLARAGLDDDKRAACEALYAALSTLARVMAPLMPFLAEALHEALGHPDSVHLCDWPAARADWQDDALVAEMHAVREVVALGRRVRESHRVRHRQPLRAARVAGLDAAALARHAPLLRAELNVGELAPLDDARRAQLAPRVTLDYERLGKRLRGDVKRVAAAVEAGQVERAADGTLRVAGGFVLAPEEYAVRYTARDAGAGVAAEGALVVLLDLATDEALLEQGHARDLLREVQALRKRAALPYRARVALCVAAGAPDAVVRAMDLARTELASRAHVTEVRRGVPDESAAGVLATAEVHVGAHAVRLTLVSLDGGGGGGA